MHPLALVVALGGSLEVVRIMVEACPEALGERLSGRRSVLHYAISEGVNARVSPIIGTCLFTKTFVLSLILIQIMCSVLV